MHNPKECIIEAIGLLLEDNQIIKLTGEPGEGGWRPFYLARVTPECDFEKAMHLLREALVGLAVEGE